MFYGLRISDFGKFFILAASIICILYCVSLQPTLKQTSVTVERVRRNGGGVGGGDKGDRTASLPNRRIFLSTSKRTQRLHNKAFRFLLFV